MNYADPFEKISKIQNDELNETQDVLLQVQRKMLQSISSKPVDPSIRLWQIASVAVVFIAILGLSFFGMLFEKEKKQVKGSLPSQWIVASASHSETKTFADHSQLILSPNASARVLETAPSTVRVQLEKGKADVKVTHSQKTNWLLEAGPYNVKVTGTHFEISWDDQKHFFALMLKKGSVVVTGPMVEEGKIIKSGEQIAAWVTEKRMELSTPDSDAVLIAQQEIGSANSLENSNTAHKMTIQHKDILPSKRKFKSIAKPNQSARTPNNGAPEITWRQLCRSGKFKTVMNQATQRGLHTCIEQGSLDDLMALGEAARLTRKRLIANEAYQKVRQRFSGTPQSTAAAFYLGKIAFDQHHSYTMATRWLTIYLHENQSGPYAKDALGRLMEAQEKIGNRSQAKKSARQYLSRYPQGTHAARAEKLLEVRQ